MKYDKDAYKELSGELKINRDALDDEVIRQPNQFFHASEGYAQAVSRRDRCKLDLDIEVASLDREIRDHAAADGDKITEAQIKHQITLEQGYHRRHRDYLDACLEADSWQALQNSFRQRADMLRSLIQLHQTGYFGEVTGAAERRASRDRYIDERRRD